MYYQIELTDALRKKAAARDRHLAQKAADWRREGVLEGRGLFGKKWKRPAPPFPDQATWDFYTGLVNVPKEVKVIFVTPDEHSELFRKTYFFEMVAGAITADNIEVSNEPFN